MVAFVETRQGSRVRVVTQGAGPAVLAIHGLGGGSYFFEGTAARLASTCRMIAVDLPGTGGSTTTSPFSIASWIDDLADVLRHIGAPAVVVGHSLGTILSLELWARCPELVRAMAFIGGLPRPRPPVRERLAARARMVEERGGLAGLGVDVAIGNLSAATIARSPETTAFFARLFDMQPTASYLACLELLLGADATRVVPHVTAPCVAISGADDRYAPPADVAAFVAALPAPTRHIVIPDVAHLPFFEAPERFADELGRWLVEVT